MFLSRAPELLPEELLEREPLLQQLLAVSPAQPDTEVVYSFARTHAGEIVIDVVEQEQVKQILFSKLTNYISKIHKYRVLEMLRLGGLWWP
jgi:hypothetical protein